jgi:hypothetical protein
MQYSLPQLCGNGPRLQVKNTFIDEAPESPSFLRSQSAPALWKSSGEDTYVKASTIDGKSISDAFRVLSDTSCSEFGDVDESTCSMDESECAGEETPTKDVLSECLVQKASTNDSPLMFHTFCLPGNHYYSNIPNYAQNYFFPQEAVQFVPLQASSMVVDSQYTEQQLHVAPQPQRLSHEDPFCGSSQLVWDEVKVPQLQHISVQEAPTGGSQIVWHADGRKLKTNDKQAVSPPFHLLLGDKEVTFKMIIYPSAQSDGKGQASFKSAKGQGRISLKCESDVSKVPALIDFSLAIGGLGKPSPSIQSQHSMHNFSKSAIWSQSNTWDMASVVDPKSETFSVCLHLMPAQ